MNLAFLYACRQLLGMSFEPFRYTAPDGVVYEWSNPFARLLCKALLGLNLIGWAECVFRLTVKVIK